MAVTLYMIVPGACTIHVLLVPEGVSPECVSAWACIHGDPQVDSCLTSNVSVFSIWKRGSHDPDVRFESARRGGLTERFMPSGFKLQALTWG